jgi:dienelactone hydrolase
MKIRNWFCWTAVLAVMGAAGVGLSQDAGAAKRKAELAWLLRTLPKSEPWEQWLQKSGELPPDFDALPRSAALPDPLVEDQNGHKVRITRAADWPRQRDRLSTLVQRYITGAAPPPPGNVRPLVRSERQQTGAVIRDVLLEFGPDHRASVSAEVMIPAGKGPFPVFLTQTTHRGWGQIALSRGYVVCVYAGADNKDDTAGFPPVWPQADWTKLMRRAYAGSRCLDYLFTLAEVDRTKVLIAGHSRNGKQALMAAAFDSRITAAISSSSGAGGSLTTRFSGEPHFGEGIELLTREFPDWMHPRLRFFTGREDRLPIDLHDLVALVAPRSCLLATAINDKVESTWAIEQTYGAVKPVYALLGHPDHLKIDWRFGDHSTRAADIERYLDWFESQTGRPGARPFPDVQIHPKYDDWLRVSGEKIDPSAYPAKGIGDLLSGSNGKPVASAGDWTARRADIVRRIQWGLGDAPPVAANTGSRYGTEVPWIPALMARTNAPPGCKKQNINFGNYITGDMYYPAAAESGKEKLPAVIFLHPASVPRGYDNTYRRGGPAHALLATQSHMVVFAFDQIGFGLRIEEGSRFYDRYPHWSMLGRMVVDVSAAIDALERVPFVDAKRIYVLGYSMGGMVALHAAALDPRIAGVISVAGFTPMRLDRTENGAAFVSRWARWRLIEPRLGAFVGNESRIPYDYHEVLSLIAPRPLWIVSPQVDTENTFADVQACVAEVRRVYRLLGAEDRIQTYFPDDYNRYSPELQGEINARLVKMNGAGSK